MREIDAALPIDGADYTILCGGSHVERLPTLPTCHRIVNAGIAGADAVSYARLVSALELKHAAEHSVLLLGSDDVACGCESHGDRSAFRRHVTGLARSLMDRSERVLVSAIPPLPADREEPRSPWSVERYSEILADVSASLGLSFFDPFFFVRGPRFGLADRELFSDDVHFVDYQWVLDEIMFSVSQDDHHW